jgi:probable Rubsico expression protein CbbX
VTTRASTSTSTRRSARRRSTRLLDELERDLIGLQPVKQRVREVAGLCCMLGQVARACGLQTERPTLHMSFTGSPGTGKTTVAMRMAKILHLLGYVRKGHFVVATRDDLVGQYVGHTAPKTKEVVKRAMGGVLFIDEAYYLYRPENERDYGQEAIEMLLQVMENHRDDLVVILAGYGERMETFFRSNPGFHSRIAHHLEFPELLGRRSASTWHCAASRRTSPTRVRCATRWIARACARRAGCSRQAGSMPRC